MCCLLGRHTRVAFEIDDIDEERESGWSVLVLGSAEWVTCRVHVDLAVEGRPRSLGRGHTHLFIMITPDTITGRIVGQPAAD